MDEYENYDAMLERARGLVEKWEAEEAAARDNMVDAYLSSLPAMAARHDAAVALRTIAECLTGCKENVPAVDWVGLRAAQTRAIRAVLYERYDPERAEAVLGVLRDLLTCGLRDGYLSEAAYRSAIDW